MVEIIFRRNKLHIQIQKGRKPIVNFFFKLPKVREDGVFICWTCTDWTESSTGTEERNVLKLSGDEVAESEDRIQ